MYRASRWGLLCATTALSAVAILSAQQAPQQQQQRQAGEAAVQGLELLTVGGDPTLGKVYLFAGTGANVVVQAGQEGAVVVDTSTEGASQAILAEIRRLTDKPIRYVINTSSDADHIGGNAVISAAGRNFAAPVPNATGVGSPPPGGGRGGGDQMRLNSAQIYAHEAVLNRLSAPAAGAAPLPVAMWPTDTFFTSKKTLYFNGDPIELRHQPAAHTDGDIIVWFRKNDVVAAGDILAFDRFPMIDLARGGSVQGMLDALNGLIDIAIPRFNQQGGTMIVPGHGRIANESDVVEYRDMATIVRDRIQTMIDKKMTLEQVLKANPVLDYEGLYDRTPSWTKQMFVEAMYRDLSRPNAQTTSR